MTTTRLWVLAVSLLMVSAFALTAGATAKVNLMTKETLSNKLDDPNVVVLDVRSGSDWRSSEYKIKGAVRVAKKDWTSLAKKYDKDKTLVFYCA